MTLHSEDTPPCYFYENLQIFTTLSVFSVNTIKKVSRPLPTEIMLLKLLFQHRYNIAVLLG